MEFLLWKVLVFCILPSVVLMSTIVLYDVNCPFPNEVFASVSGGHCEQKCWIPELRSVCFYKNVEQNYEESSNNTYIGCICATGFARNTVSGMCVPVHQCKQYSKQITVRDGYPPWGLMKPILAKKDENPRGPQPPPPYEH